LSCTSCLRHVLMFSKRIFPLYVIQYIKNIDIYFLMLVSSRNIRHCPHRKYFRFRLRSNSICPIMESWILIRGSRRGAPRWICRYEQLDLRCAAKIPRNRMESGVGPNCIAAGWRYLGSRNYFLAAKPIWPVPSQKCDLDWLGRFSVPPPCALPPWPLKSPGLNPSDWTLGAIWHAWICIGYLLDQNHSRNGSVFLI